MVQAGIIITAGLHFEDILPISLIFIMTGFTATLVGIGAQTLIQLEVDENYRARVMTWWSTICLAALSLAASSLGF